MFAKKTRKPVKRFVEGGSVREGRNENIDDDTRARALAWVAKGGDGEKAAPKVSVAPKPAPKPAQTDTGDGSNRLAARQTTRPADTPKVERTPTSLPVRGNTSEIPSMDAPSKSAPNLSLADRAIQTVRNAVPGNSPLDSLNAFAPGVASALNRGAVAAVGGASRALRMGRAEKAAEVAAETAKEVAKRQAVQQSQRAGAVREEARRKVAEIRDTRNRPRYDAEARTRMDQADRDGAAKWMAEQEARNVARHPANIKAREAKEAADEIARFEGEGGRAFKKGGMVPRGWGKARTKK